MNRDLKRAIKEALERGPVYEKICYVCIALAIAIKVSCYSHSAS